MQISRSCSIYSASLLLVVSLAHFPLDANAQTVINSGGNVTPGSSPGNQPGPGITPISGGPLVPPVGSPGAGGSPPQSSPAIPPTLQNVNSAARFAPAVVPGVNTSFPNLGVPTDRIMWGFGVGTSSSQKLPVAAVGRVLPNMAAMDERSFSLRHDGTAQFKVTGDQIDLTAGSILLVTHKPTEVRCGETLITLDNGSAVEISTSPEGVYVRTLINDHKRGVVVRIGTDERLVAVGTELCLASSEQAIKEVLNDRIPRREERMEKIASGKFLWISSVSLSHLITGDAVLVTMYRRGGTDRSLVAKVHKMAAALHYLSGRRGPYRVIDPARKISLAP